MAHTKDDYFREYYGQISRSHLEKFYIDAGRGLDKNGTQTISFDRSGALLSDRNIKRLMNTNQYINDLNMSVTSSASAATAMSRDMSDESKALRQKITEITDLGAALPIFNHIQRKYMVVLIYDEVTLPNGDKVKDVSLNKEYLSFEDACDGILDHFKFRS